MLEKDEISRRALRDEGGKGMDGYYYCCCVGTAVGGRGEVGDKQGNKIK